MSDIELSVIVEKRSIYIHLDYISSLGLLFLFLLLGISSTFIALFHNSVEFINLVDDCDSSTLIRIFSRFYNPNISGLQFILLAFFLSFDELCSFLIILGKPFILLIFEAIFDVESQWYIVKYILSYFFVVLLQVIKQSFFVAQMEVVFEMVMDYRLDPIVVMFNLLTVLVQEWKIIQSSDLLILLVYLYSFG